MAKILTKAGITTGNTVEAFHVTQSIDAFTGIDAYDISLSGSFNMTGSINVSEDLFVGDTVYVGNVTGTPTTNASLYVRQPSITGSSESPIIDIQVDDANSYFRIGNATASDGFFTPSIGTRQSDSPDRLSLFFDALVEDAQDTPGAADVMRFRARRDTPDFIQNRDLYAWYNYTTRLMDMDKDGNLNIVASVTASSYTGSFVGDGSGITSIVSSSYAVTASYALNSPAGTDTNFANTDLTFTADRNHDSNGFDFIVTADSGAFNSAYVGYSLTPSLGMGLPATTSSFIGIGNSYLQIDSSSTGNTFSEIRIAGTSSILAGDSELTINSQNKNHDFVVYGATDTSLLVTDASTDRVGIGKNTPNSKLDVNGDTIISGSTTIKNLGSTALNVIGSGSNNILEVNGSVGELLSVTDSNTGALFTVNNSASETMLQVNSDNTITYGIPSKPALQTTTTANVGTSPTVIYNIPTSSYTGAFVEYTITSESNARTGKIDAIWNSGTINFADVTGSGIGTTSGFTFAVILSGSNAVITGSASTTDWTVNAIIRSI